MLPHHRMYEVGMPQIGLGLARLNQDLGNLKAWSTSTSVLSLIRMSISSFCGLAGALFCMMDHCHQGMLLPCMGLLCLNVLAVSLAQITRLDPALQQENQCHSLSRLIDVLNPVKMATFGRKQNETVIIYQFNQSFVVFQDGCYHGDVSKII